MGLLFGAFIAGILTVLAPCVLPLLPVIIGGSVSGDASNKRRPLIIAVSLAVSIILFTLLLKATAVLINIPPSLLTDISGGIIILLGLATLFPTVYQTFILKIGIETKAQETLSKGARSKNKILGSILIGAALGPVFSSCSPVYAYILATVLPVSFGNAMVYLISYALGLSTILLIISHFGQRAVKKMKFASNPRGWFQRTLGIIFIIVGLLIATGYNQQFQVWVSDHTPFNFDGLSAQLLPAPAHPITDNTLFNVTPYQAPDFQGISQWINSPALTVSSLKGKVVLVDFWTYSCINCIRNNVYLEKWYNLYKDDGFVVVGVSAPEFSFEKVVANVEDGVKKQGLTYPVAMDNDYGTWNAYSNQYWPAGYLIDATGQVRRQEFGEGDYNQTEQAIRQLLQQNGAHLSNTMVTNGSETVPVANNESQETYLGTARASNYMGTTALTNGTATFTPASSDNLAINSWTLGGTWEVDADQIVAKGNSTLQFNAASKEMYLVAGSTTPAVVKVSFDGKPITAANSGPDVQNGSMMVGESRLYSLVANPTFTTGYIVTLEVPNGVAINTFTFGS